DRFTAAGHLAKAELLYLAGRRLGQGDEADLPGTLELREPVPAERDHLLFGDRPDPQLQLDKRAGHLTPLVVRFCHDGSVQYSGVLVKNVLYLDGGDVLSPRNDDVLLPVGDLKIAIRVNDRDVAGVEPSTGKGLCRARRIFQ